MSARQKGTNSLAGDDEEMPDAAPSRHLSEPLQQCNVILKFLLDMAEAEPYSAPVDWEFYGLTDYPEIIKNPMDLGTIQTKMDDRKYPTPEKFAADVRLVWKNAMTYNRPDSDIYITADTLSKRFERKFAQIKKPAGASGASAAPAPRKSEQKRDGQLCTDRRRRFSQLVNQLSSDDLEQLVSMIQRDCPQAINEHEDQNEIDIEINAIDSSTLVTLIDFAQTCVTNAATKQKAK